MLDEAESAPVSDSNSYTIRADTRILCARYNASGNPCQTYVMSDSYEHLIICPLGPNNQPCEYGAHWTCDPHTHAYNSGSGSNPVDNTPNCQDCTSDCSVPCNCTNSGTCGGTPTDNTPNCSYCTNGCSSCDDDDDSSEVTCGAASWTGCTTSVSSETEHKVWSCSHCGKSYWTCGSSVLRHTETFTCVRSGCGVTFTRCTNKAGDCLNPNYVWHKKP